MADVQKSVQISYRADIKQLLESLKTIPGMTEKEAKSMVKNLDRQLKQASRAAKNAGTASAAGMQKFKMATNQARTSVMGLRRESANLQRLSGDLAAGLGEVSPEAGNMAMSLTMAASGVQALFRALTLTNPALIVAAAVAAAVTSAVYAMTLENKEAEKQLDSMRKGVQDSYDAWRIAAENIKEVREQSKAARREAGEKTGMKIFDLEQTINEMKGLRTIQDEYEDKAAEISKDVRDSWLAEMKLAKEAKQAELDMLEKQRQFLVKQVSLADLAGNANKAAAEKHKKELISTSGKIRKLNHEVKELNKDIQDPENASSWRELKSTLAGLLTQFIQLGVSQKKTKKASGGISRRHQKYNDGLRESIQLLSNVKSNLDQQYTMIDQAEKQRQAIVLANLKLEEKRLKELAKQAEGEEKIALIKQAQQMSEKIQKRQQAAKIKAIFDQLQANRDNLKASKEAVEQAKARLDILNKQNPRYAKQKENREAQAELAKAEAAFEEQKLWSTKAESAAAAALDEQRKNGIETLNQLRLKGEADVQKAKEQAAKRAAIERDKELKHLLTITDNFMSSANKIAEGQTTLWQRQSDKLAERQTEAAANLDKMVEKGIITQAEAEEKKARSEELFKKKRFETEMKIYKLNKATAIADVIFNSARAASRMLAFPPPAGPLLAAAAAGSAMAQIAVIASAPAPTMHAGGMVPDETQITALKGEAVLNRAAVRNAGGPEGIHKMNRGESSGEKIIVIQPFKHFDRFVRASQRRGILAQPTAKTGSGGY